MIKTLLTVLIVLMLCVIPVTGFAPHDCDLDSDGMVDISDLVIMSDVYLNTYKYWHISDFDRNYQIGLLDLVIMSDVYGYTLPDSAWRDTLYLDDSTSVCRVYENDILDWIEEWTVIDYHIHNGADYVCVAFALDTSYSYRDDYNFRGTYVVMDDDTSHSYVAILKGDNPYRKSNWVFIEPQNDNVITYPYDNHIRILLDADRGISDTSIESDVHIEWAATSEYGSFEYVHFYYTWY